VAESVTVTAAEPVAVTVAKVVLGQSLEITEDDELRPHVLGLSTRCV
jgi:hypothetical protein